MPRVFYGNYWFEQEVHGTQPARSPPRAIVQHQAELSVAWVALAEAEDIILTPSGRSSSDWTALTALGNPLPRFVDDPGAIDDGPARELVPWGWTRGAVELARRRGWRAAPPPLELVRLVNSRAYRLRLEQELGVSLPGSAVVTTLDELRSRMAALESSPGGWILKANFGMAGRESLRGRGPLDDPGNAGGAASAAANWARTRLERWGCLVVEPLVEPVAEAGIQLEIPRSGAPRLVGVAPQRVAAGGVYRGSRFGAAEDESPWQEASGVAQEVAARLAALGYHGPLGIDAMLYREAGGALRLRPLQDLNARFTMGRLALAFRRLLPAGWCGSWLHVAERPPRSGALGERIERLRRQQGDQARVATTGARSVLVLAAGPEIRTAAEHSLEG